MTSYCTIDSASNHSDHIPVALSLRVSISSQLFDSLSSIAVYNRVDKPAVDSVRLRRLRWDHADTDSYYAYTRSFLYPIYNDIMQFTSSDECPELGTAIVDQYYARIISVLKSAELMFIPNVPSNLFKSWWSEDLRNLKAKAVQSHRIWEMAGKPKHGQAFDLKAKDKLLYKKEIRESKNREIDSVTDSLHETLLNKSSTKF